KNPYPVIIPCHRVIKSDGKIGGYAYGGDVKSNMLAKEGITIDNGKIVDLENMMHRF
ncbi:MAG: MGMT family protein, partial [Nitrosarchaeum sp.]|nr:MGMT family protein [Nitrosarchaeum sp.]